MKAVFSGLAPLVIEGVDREEAVVRVGARTPDVPVACPGCGVPAERVRGCHLRRLADLSVDGCPVVVELRVRRLVCPTTDCSYQAFREQVPGVAERYQRRTSATVPPAPSGSATADLWDGLAKAVEKTVTRLDVLPDRTAACLVDPCRDYIRRRLAEEPDVPRSHLFEEIRERGYPGSANLFWRYL